MSPEIPFREEKMLTMHARGRGRAEAGRPIVMQAVRGIKDPERIREYLSGYMGVVEKSLEDIGIVSPIDLGIHESFMHVVVQDPFISGTTGIEGLNDGMRLHDIDLYHEGLGKSHWNHYRDGHKIGVAFARANIRQGKFEAMAEEEVLAMQHRQLARDEVKTWLTSRGIATLDPQVVIHLHPIARLSFAHVINYGEEGLGAFRQSLEERVRRNEYYTDEKKDELISGIDRSMGFAKGIRGRMRS